MAPTLTRGLVIVGAPATQAEGAVWNFSYLGESVCVTIQGNVAAFCNGSAI